MKNQKKKKSPVTAISPILEKNKSMIFRLYFSGDSCLTIARLFCCSEETIRRFIKKHLIQDSSLRDKYGRGLSNNKSGRV